MATYNYELEVYKLTPNSTENTTEYIWIPTTSLFDNLIIQLTNFSNTQIDTIRYWEVVKFKVGSDSPNAQLQMSIEVETITQLRGNSILLVNQVFTPNPSGNILEQILSKDTIIPAEYDGLSQFISDNYQSWALTPNLLTTIDKDKWYGLIVFNNTVNNILFSQSGIPNYELNFYVIEET